MSATLCLREEKKIFGSQKHCWWDRMTLDSVSGNKWATVGSSHTFFIRTSNLNLLIICLFNCWWIFYLSTRYVFTRSRHFIPTTFVSLLYLFVPVCSIVCTCCLYLQKVQHLLIPWRPEVVICVNAMPCIWRNLLKLEGVLIQTGQMGRAYIVFFSC